MGKNNKSFGLKSKILHGSNWIITISAVVAITVLLNIIFGMITDKLQLKIDLTANRVIGITDITKKALNSLEKDVNIYLIEDTTVDLPYLDEIIDKYIAETDRVKYEKIDIRSNPAFMNQFNISANDVMTNSLIVSCGDKYKLIYPYDIFPVDVNGNMGSSIDAEGVLTSAITYVTSDKNIKIGLIEGHDEYDFLNSTMGATLMQQYIDYEYINLYTQNIPEDINYLVICGPEKDFTDEEITKIDEYLNKGNHLQVMYSVTAPQLTNLNSYFNEWGVTVNNDTIKENNPNFQYNGQDTHVWVEGETCEITSGLSQMVIPFTKSFAIDRNVNLSNLDITSVFSTSPQATSVDNTTGEETDGQFDLSLLVEDKLNNASILFVGTYHLFSEAFIESNSKFFTNALSYQTGSVQTTIIQPKSLLPASLDMSASDIQLSSIIVIFLIPFSILVWGFLVWLRRRHL